MSFVIVIGMMFTAFAATVGTVKLSSGSMSIRKSASTTSASLGTVKNGTKVSVISSSGDWYKITYGKITGYVMKKYITNSTTTASTSTSTSSTKTGTITSATKLYKTASTKATSLVSLATNAKITIVGETTSYYKATYGTKTGYVLKTKVKVATSVVTTPKPTASTPSNTVKPGQTVGYASWEIAPPADPATNKAEVVNAINWNLTNVKTTFTINIKDLNAGQMIPGSTSAFEYTDIKGGFKSITPGTKTAAGITPVTFTVEYEPSAYVISFFKNGTTIPTSNANALDLKKRVDAVITKLKISTLSDYDKVVAIHDYVVSTYKYDKAQPSTSRNAYGVMTTLGANCTGFADVSSVLYSAAGIENRIVWATSLVPVDGGSGTHTFNKVKVNGAWYNVDTTADDPYPDVAGRIKRDYLLVTDKISSQRYSWEASRYPAATSTKDNWHYKNGMVADTQAKLESLVKAGVAKKQTQISVWIPQYSAGKFTTGFATKISGVKSATVKTTPAATSFKTWGTAMFFEVKY